ncbi:MAG TPA: universal stress protein [Dissulfurispiraceae bacterium]|nr:universal stress protein [Dissulfurispiraceae bacterium]
MTKKILVGFDGSDQAYKAFDFALDLVKMCTGAAVDIFVVAVAQPPEAGAMLAIEAIIKSAKEHYEDLFKDLREKARERNLEVRTEVAVGHPADQIIRYVKEQQSDMVVVGQKGKSMIEDWLMGSVSRRVARYAPCTVIIVK